MGEPLTLALAAGETPLAPVLSEPWVTPDALAGAGVDESVDLTSVCAVATEILFELSGRRFGVRTETVRPRSGQGSCGWANIGFNPGGGGDWLGFYLANVGAPDWLRLRSPVRSVLSVKVDGVSLNSSNYILYDNARLVRVGALWPIYQNLDLPDTETGTFSVTYQWGADVPAGAKLAAREFAAQLGKYVNRDSDCALPDRTISVTRQGVSQTIMDPSQFIKEARTGLYLVDTWLGSVNPRGARRPSSVTGPDDVLLARPT